MLAGRTAFTGDYEQAVIYKILHEEPEAISLLRPDVSTSAARVIGRALRKDPRERYSSMGELLADLEAGGPGSAPSGWGKKRPQAGFLARHRRAAAALLVLAAATAGGLVLMKWTHPAGSVDPALAVMDFEDLGGSGDTLAAAGLNGLLQVGLIERSPVRVVSPEYLQDVQRRLFSGAIGAVRPERAIEVARRAGASLLLSGQLGGRKGATYVVWRLIETGRGRSVGGSRIEYSELVGLADGIIAEVVPLIAAQARVEATAAAGSVERITSSSPEAFRRFTAAEAAIARDAKDDALQELEAAVRIDSTFALAYLRITDIYWERTEFVPARKYANKAWSLRARLGIKDRMLLESRRLQLDRHIAAAMDVYGEMMARWPDDRSILQSYVYALYWWWYFSEAQGVAEMAIERYPDDETFHSIREAALRVQGKGAEALASARAYRRRHPEDPASWSRIGESHLVAGSIDSAEASFRRALGMKPDDLSMEHDLARIPFLRGDTEMAREMLERLITRTNSYGWIFQFHFGNGIQFVVPGLVHCYCETGRLSRALELADAFNLSFEQDAERLVQATHMEATLLLDWGRPRAVLDLARDLSAMDEVDYAQAFALRLRTEALVDLDSLDAAREGLEEILGRKDWFGVFVRYVPHLLAARLALAEGRPESALAHLDSLDVACTQKWETRARAYRAMNRLPEAAAVLEDLLRINSGRFIARYALGQIYEEMGRRADAARQYEIFLKAWENADPGWPQVEDARRRLAALRVASGA
jgi:tetratricopeptide (TPR) repeat protein